VVTMGYDPFRTAVVLTLLVLFAVGAAPSLVTDEPWWRSGAEILAAGAAAAAVAYGVGAFVEGFVA